MTWRGAQACAALPAALKASPGLTLLDLSRNQLGAEGAKAVSTLIRSVVCGVLQWQIRRSLACSVLSNDSNI